MAYINVKDWKCDQVLEWIKGIEIDECSSYIDSFFNNQVDGQQLLNISFSELVELGITKIGHQEIILESIEHLKNFHFNLEKENLQHLALKVATVSTSLYKQLYGTPESKLETSTLSEVARIITKIKVLISWLDRYPFQGHSQYNEIRTQMLRLALELATVGQRDRFVQNPTKQITILSEKLSKLADYIIQDISDPMILQPAYLELLTLKKKESDLGFYILPSYQFIHRITDVKFNSPAHYSGKIEEGDEIVQINYQTVVGWQFKKVLEQLQEPSTDVLLTLKKRPRHNNRIYGQLGLIKLPSKKRSLPYPSSRVEQPISIETIPENLPPKQPIKENISDAESSETESDILTPTDVKSFENEFRMYLPKPRTILQRRHTICGDDFVNYKKIGNIVLWHERKLNNASIDPGSLKDKSVSISFGLNTRPSTSLGILNDSRNMDYFKKFSFNILNRKIANTDTILENDAENDEDQSNLKGGVTKALRFGSSVEQNYTPDSEKYTCKVQDTIIECYTPIPYLDDDIVNDQKCTKVTNAKQQVMKSDIAEAINDVIVKRDVTKRGRLDKSFSTPTYDIDTGSNGFNFDIPPRKQQNVIPPVPPRKPIGKVQSNHAPRTAKIEHNPSDNKNKFHDFFNGAKALNNSIVSQGSNYLKNEKEQETIKKSSEISELIKPSKIKTLTNKKKNSLIAKRRKISLKSLGTNSAATIQGHLYRRAKDKSEVAYWTKMYFVLMDIALYGYRNKEAQKADCAIFLNGFTVTLAKEVHSKEFAFKVYHPKKTFYFAAETSEAMVQWIEYIRLATLKGTVNLECEPRELYSETEWCSEEDSDANKQKQSNTSSPISNQLSSEKTSGNEQTPPLQKGHYHLNFGSLKKTFGRYNNTNDPLDSKFLGLFSSNKNEKKSSTDIIPTAQFKTYRKVSSNGGLQLGATSMINSNISDTYSSSAYGLDSNSLFNVFNSDNQSHYDDKPIKRTTQLVNKKNEKLSHGLRKHHNFLHASNPNLLDFNFHHAVDFPTLNTSNCNWDHQNHQTGMTLLDLMLQQRAEEMKDMYDKRVDQGFERSEEKNIFKTQEKKIVKPHEEIFIDKKLLEIQKRSLPTPPDYEFFFKPSDQAILYTRSKEGLKLRDFGYELISNDDENMKKEQLQLDVKCIESKSSLSKRKIAPLSGSMKKKSGFTWIISHDENQHQLASQTDFGNSASFRKQKSGNSNKQQKTDAFGESMQNTMKKINNINSQQELQATSKILRKNSAPVASSSVIPYFTKLSFSSSSEKRLLGSPKLHRAIFGRSNNSNNTSASPNSTDHEIFTSITFPKQPETQKNESRSSNKSASKVPNIKSYSDLSLPPVFKAETYSFCENK